ncbi:MAG: 50S ribosomal protein L20, partial [Rubrobacter sp.]|nr:50S ribosomal protein L20 [Rubrobacter sp.]
GAREHGLSYSQLIHGLKLAEIDLDRKILADLAATEPDAFGAIVAQAQNALNGDPVQRRIEVERKPEEPRKQEPAPMQATGALVEAEASTEAEASAENTSSVDDTDAAERKAEESDVEKASGDEES